MDEILPTTISTPLQEGFKERANKHPFALCILNKGFIEKMAEENAHRAFRNSAKIRKLLSLTIAEGDASPTYYVLDKVSAKLSLPTPPVATVLRKLKDGGFQAVPTHFSSRGVRTDASALAMQNLLAKLSSSYVEV